MKKFIESIKKAISKAFQQEKPSEEPKAEIKSFTTEKFEQKRESTKAHGLKDESSPEEGRKKRNKYFHKQKGKGTKAHHGLPGDKTEPKSSRAEVKVDKDTKGERKNFIPKKRPEQKDSTYRKRENVKKE